MEKRLPRHLSLLLRPDGVGKQLPWAAQCLLHNHLAKVLVAYEERCPAAAHVSIYQRMSTKADSGVAAAEGAIIDGRTLALAIERHGWRVQVRSSNTVLLATAGKRAMKVELWTEQSHGKAATLANDGWRQNPLPSVDLLVVCGGGAILQVSLTRGIVLAPQKLCIDLVDGAQANSFSDACIDTFPRGCWISLWLCWTRRSSTTPHASNDMELDTIKRWTIIFIFHFEFPKSKMDDDLDQELLDLMASGAAKATEEATVAPGKASAGVATAGSAKSKKSTTGTAAGNKKRASTGGNAAKRRRRGAADDSDDVETSDESDFSQDAGLSSNESDWDEDLELTDYDEDEDDGLEDLSLNERGLLAEVDPSELVGLTELEREALLSERAEKRQQLLERIQIKKRLREGVAGVKRKLQLDGYTLPYAPVVQRIGKTRAASGSTMTTQRKKSKDKLAQLKAHRQGNKSALADMMLDAEAEDADFASKLQDLEASEDEQDYRKLIRKTYDNYEDESRMSKTLSLEDLNGIRLTRDHLEKWMYAPFFKDTVTGCFVRIGIGIGKNQLPAYRVAQISDVVDYHRVYKVNDTQTKKALRLRHGKAEKVFLMDIVSNQDFTEMEFQRWMQTLKVEKLNPPPPYFIRARVKAIADAHQHVFAEIDAMVKEKQKALPIARNLAREKAQLILKKEQLLQEGRDATALLSKIHKLESAIEETASAPPDVWSKLNERNRKLNLAEASKAEQMARVEKSQGNGRTGLDPFARIKATSHQLIEGPKSPEDQVVDASSLLQVLPAATDGYNEGEGRVITSPQDDLFADVDLEIEI